MKEKIPVDYKVQQGCHCCKHVYIRYEYDSPDEYLCHEDGSERPLNCSVAMRECPFDETKEERYKRHRDWDKWYDEHLVESWGICSKFEKEE